VTAGIGFGSSVPGQQVNQPIRQPTMTQNASNTGDYTCPWCWWKFEAKNVKWVATHPALKGDPLLGRDSYLRFIPNSFSGQKALDSQGGECTEIACPHCHNEVPLTMLRLPQHLISLVGDAQSGKSYLLTVMTKVLQDSLVRNYGTFLEDATPKANASIREMIRTLFGANSINEGMHLQKTKLDGEMYHRLKRNGEGREILLPRPFIFHMKNNSSDAMNMVFYDNAGEHFQPGSDSTENPSAQHVAKAGGLMFLFDPFNNIDFKKAMKSVHTGDPQFDKPVFGDVVAIMSEMKKRIKDITGEDRLKAPLAFIVGKYDAWGASLLKEGEQFYETNTESCLSAAAIHHNSNIVRRILMEKCPGVLGVAESLSDTVMFFPVSSFGAPARKAVMADGNEMTIPDPETLNPFLVDAPILWLMNRINPKMIPMV